MAKKSKIKETLVIAKDPDYLLKMAYADKAGNAVPLFQMLPVIIFTAITILIVRLHVYSRPMSQFFWTSETDESQISDFFSYNKMILIVVCAVMALVILLFLFVSQSLMIKRSIIYIPMCIYAVFVLISYITSHYKVFALWGYNDRFEGTIPLLCYMVMLFYTINVINSEREVKVLFWPLAISAVILSLIGISQGIGHDFFRTVLGQKLISPNYTMSDGSTLWQAIEEAFDFGETYYNFTFQNNEIYQTVYNINYVSFYLTLLIPLFGMLFIRAYDKGSEEPVWKKIALAILFALIVYNFIGSNSSGGFLGLGVIGILGIIILNKQLAKIWKPLVILFVIAGIMFGITANRWIPELANAFSNLGAEKKTTQTANGPASVKPYIDYIKTGSTLEFSIEGNPLIIDFGDNNGAAYLILKDSDGKEIGLKQEDDGYFSINDKRFYDYAKLALIYDDEVILDIQTVGSYEDEDTFDWYFKKYNDNEISYINGLGNNVALKEIPHNQFFFERPNFGSGRGYIWAASLPLIRHTLLRGYGADTYCIVFPQNDFAGRYNSGYENMWLIVDKPHNMYIHVAIGTGVVSLIALLAIYGIYVVQSIKLFWKRELGTDYLTFAGFGLFCGLTAFMVTGLVDDSTVSVMPMFYGLLGTGIAINFLIRKREKKN